MEPQRFPLSLNVKIGVHGCQYAIMSRKAIANFQLFTVHLDFVPPACHGGIKLLQCVTVLKFSLIWICEDVTWPTSLGLS